MSYIDPSMEGMLDTFLFETGALLDQLDEILLACEKTKSISTEHINEIFRIMHTTKGSAAMMGLESMSALAHTVEDIFFIVREDPARMQSVNEELFDLVFQASDYLRGEIDGLQSDDYQPADTKEMLQKLETLAAAMKGEESPAAAVARPAGQAAPAAEAAGAQMIRVFFEDGCQMENIRAFMLLNQLKDVCEELDSDPQNPEADSSCAPGIVKNGFIIKFKPAGSLEDVHRVIESALNVKSYEAISSLPPAQAASVPASSQEHTVRVFFEDGCQMENIRAFMLLNQLKDVCEELESDPQNPETDSSLCKQIIDNGFIIKFKCAGSPDDIYRLIENAINVKSYEKLAKPAGPAAEQNAQTAGPMGAGAGAGGGAAPKAAKQSLISVNQAKLDHLMDLVGEIVTAESMVSANPDLRGMKLENFSKSTRELRKLTDELQDVVMSMRMVPISGVFQKMQRIVRDMCKKLGKEAELVTNGGDTEVDKTINDSINDPFMHMVRNSVDHGIEMPEDRVRAGKPRAGKVTLSAQNAGSEIIITIADDGAGLDRDKILAKAKKNGMLTKPEKDYADKEIYGMIMLPGFSTNENVTEFSGRGVGMDVVRKNLESVGGTVTVESKQGEGSVFTIKIPLTLAIVDGMGLMVGEQLYILPISSIRQSFKVSEAAQVIHDTDGSEMILLRGQCYPVIRLHQAFDAPGAVSDLNEGILVLTETDRGTACLFADELIGEQQVVVKPFPPYLAKYGIKERGLSGCSIMGDGTISLIIDCVNLIGGLEGR